MPLTIETPPYPNDNNRGSCEDVESRFNWAVRVLSWITGALSTAAAFVLLVAMALIRQRQHGRPKRLPF